MSTYMTFNPSISVYNFFSEGENHNLPIPHHPEDSQCVFVLTQKEVDVWIDAPKHTTDYEVYFLARLCEEYKTSNPEDYSLVFV
jgi:hypothetical protein